MAGDNFGRSRFKSRATSASESHRDGLRMYALGKPVSQCIAKLQEAGRLYAESEEEWIRKRATELVEEIAAIESRQNADRGAQ